jgi:hypothetical protein
MSRRRRRTVKLPSRRIKGRLQKLKQIALGLAAKKVASHLVRNRSRSEAQPRAFAAEPPRRREAEARDDQRELLDLYARLRRSHGSL